MSIIQEALKKAQNNYTERESTVQMKEALVEKAPPQPMEPVDRAPVNKSMPNVIYIIILFVLVAAFGIRMIFPNTAPTDKEKISKNLIPEDLKSDPIKPSQASIASNSASRAADKLVNFVSAGLINRPPDLVLNGIMYVEERPKAIINGTVVTEGDVISGATVTSIGQDKVLVKYNSNDNKIEMALKLKE